MNLSIIGDSHVRGYRDRENIYPLFLGSGKKINLFAKNYDNLVMKINAAIQSLDFVYKSPPSDYIYLSLGEPDCRHQLGYGWYPQNHENVDPVVNEEILNECVRTYSALLKALDEQWPDKNIFILTASTHYPAVIPSIRYFNDLLLDKFESRCVDLTSALDSLDDYQGSDIIGRPDLIHLSTNISNLFLDRINEMGHIIDTDDYESHMHIDQNFGCLRLELTND
tara:strand:+ start:90 stop:761 length:672 start_codon:yes stop_codon:yes gene_type:complete